MRTKLAIYMAGVAVAAFAPAAYAQDVSAANAEQAGSDEIVVTATRRAETLTKVPMNVQAITSQEISNNAITNFKDINTLVPGLSLSQDASGNSASIRGVRTDSVSAAPQSLDIYFNDVPVLAYSVFGALYDVGQIEVLRGPQGTMRGRTAPTGAITITSKRPGKDAFGGYLEGQVLGEERLGHTLQGAVGGPIVPGVLALRVAGFYQKDDLNGTRSITTGAESKEILKSGRATLLFTPTDNLEILATYQYNDTRRDTIARVATTPGSDPNPQGGPVLTGRENLGVAESPSFQHQKYQYASLNAKYDFGFATLNYIGGWTKDVSDTEGRPGLDPGNAISNFDNLPGKNARVEVQQWSHELRLQSNYNPGDLVDWSLGYYRSNGGSRVAQTTTLVGINSGGLFGAPVAPGTPIVMDGSLIHPTYLSTGVLDLHPGSFNIFGDNGRDLNQSIYASATVHLPTRTHIRVGGRYLWGWRDINFALNWDQPGIRGAFIPVPVGFNCASFGFLPSDYPGRCDIYVPDRPLVDVGLNLRSKNSNWAYDANIRQEIGDNLNAYFTYGHSFRTPGATQGNVPIEYILLKPETSNNYEVGLKGELFNRRARFTISAFQQDFKDYNASISNIPFLQAGTVSSAFFLAYNANARVRGFEADISGDITDRWSARASVSYVKSNFKNAAQPCNDSDGDRVPDGGTMDAGDFPPGTVVVTCPSNGAINGLPNWNATFQSEYSVPIEGHGRGYVRGLVSYQGDAKILSTGTKIPRYATFDAFAGVEYDNFRAGVFAKNLLNTTRMIDQNRLNTFSAINTGYTQVFYTTGLQIGANVAIKFGR